MVNHMVMVMAPMAHISLLYASLVKAMDANRNKFGVLAIMSMMLQNSFPVEYNISDYDGFPWSDIILWKGELKM